MPRPGKGDSGKDSARKRKGGTFHKTGQGNRGSKKPEKLKLEKKKKKVRPPSRVGGSTKAEKKNAGEESLKIKNMTI